jgi:hypothetical protein
MDLAAWTAKLPPKAEGAVSIDSDEESSNKVSDNGGESAGRSPVSISSSQGSDVGDIVYDPDATEWQAAQNSDSGNIEAVLPQFKRQFYIDVPPMDEEEKEQYEYLPGHFAVRNIISEPGSGRFNVRLESGEMQEASLLQCMRGTVRLRVVTRETRSPTAYCRLLSAFAFTSQHTQQILQPSKLLTPPTSRLLLYIHLRSPVLAGTKIKFANLHSATR